MNSDGKIEIGRLQGIPVLVDPAFPLVMAAVVYPFLALSQPHSLSVGILVSAGLVASVMARALARAVVVGWQGNRLTRIELGPLGERAVLQAALQCDRSMHMAPILAAPAASLALWIVFSTLWRETSGFAAQSNDVALAAGLTNLAGILWYLAQANLILFAMSLLPAHGLDGGRALQTLAAPRLGDTAARHLIARAGFTVAGVTAVSAYFLGPVMLLLAAFVMLENVAAAERSGRPPRHRSS